MSISTKRDYILKLLKNVIKFLVAVEQKVIKFFRAGEHSDELTDCCKWESKKR
jgi:hypothetical protein